MILSITAAAKKIGIGRSTLYAMRKRGDISFIKKKDGSLAIDVSELERVFSDKTSTSLLRRIKTALDTIFLWQRWREI
jgi:predicted site-specific integrase-resolvase